MLRIFRTFGLRSFFDCHIRSLKRSIFFQEWSTDQRPTYDHNARGNLASKARDAFHRSSSISTRLPVQRIHPPHVHLGNGELYRGA